MSAVLRVAAVIVVALGICAYGLSGYQTWTDDEPVATATITEVRHAGSHRRIYDVVFVTPDGLACQSTVDTGRTDAPLTWQPAVGDTVKVTYGSSGLPCENVAEAGNDAMLMEYAIRFAFLLVGLIAAYVACRSLSRGGHRWRSHHPARARFS